MKKKQRYTFLQYILLNSILFVCSVLVGRNIFPIFNTYIQTFISSAIQNAYPYIRMNEREYSEYGQPAKNVLATESAQIHSIDIPISGKIVFIKEGELWWMNTDKTNLEQITRDEYEKIYYSISPNHLSIVYTFIPKNHAYRTNLGTYDGYHTGVGIVTVLSKMTKIIIPYGDRLQHMYPIWSPDSKFISVWNGNGLSSDIFDTTTGELIKRFVSDDYLPVSPIVWIGKTGKISMIRNQKLLTSYPNGSGEIIMSEQADPVLSVHEGQNIPLPPYWTTDGKQVTFYQKGNLIVLDTKSNMTYKLVSSLENSITGGIVPQGFFGSYDATESGILYQDVGKVDDVQYFDLKSQIVIPYGGYGNSIRISRNKINISKIDLLGNIIIMSLSDGSSKLCSNDFIYPTSNFFDFPNEHSSIWSFDNSALLGSVKDQTARADGLSILSISDCHAYTLFPTGSKISQAKWIQ